MATFRVYTKGDNPLIEVVGAKMETWSDLRKGGGFGVVIVDRDGAEVASFDGQAIVGVVRTSD